MFYERYDTLFSFDVPDHDAAVVRTYEYEVRVGSDCAAVMVLCLVKSVHVA